jgi:hypothetical protein
MYCKIIVFSVRLWEASLQTRQTLVEPFVHLTSLITKPPGQYLPLSS